jgi:hypothetical protein
VVLVDIVETTYEERYGVALSARSSDIVRLGWWTASVLNALAVYSSLQCARATTTSTPAHHHITAPPHYHHRTTAAAVAGRVLTRGMRARAARRQT